MKIKISNMFQGDKGIWLILLLLAMFSISSVYSASASSALTQNLPKPYFFFRQLTVFCLGTVIIIVVHRFQYMNFGRASKFLLRVAIVLLLITLFFGMDQNGARRRLMLPGRFTFQPSDFAKLALIMYLAYNLYLKEEGISSFKEFYKLVLPVFIVCGLIFPSNLSTAMILFVVSLIMIFFSKIKFKYLASLIGVVLVGGVLMIYIVKTNKDVGRFATWSNRIDRFFDSGEEAVVDQEKYAKVAVATGGLFGNGPGHSVLRNKIHLPNSDYIFAIIVEEYGLLFGAVPLLFLYMFLFLRVKRIVKKVDKSFGAYLAAGLVTLIMIQAFVNMAVATDIIPITGQTLPFVSWGGSSIITFSFAFAMILSVSRSVKRQEKRAMQQQQQQSSSALPTDPPAAAASAKAPAKAPRAGASTDSVDPVEVLRNL